MAAGPCSFTGASPVLPPKLGELLSKSCAVAGRACGLAVLPGGGHPLPALETTVDRFHGGLGVGELLARLTDCSNILGPPPLLCGEDEEGDCSSGGGVSTAGACTVGSVGGGDGFSSGGD